MAILAFDFYKNAFDQGALKTLHCNCLESCSSSWTPQDAVSRSSPSRATGLSLFNTFEWNLLSFKMQDLFAAAFIYLFSLTGLSIVSQSIDNLLDLWTSFCISADNLQDDWCSPFLLASKVCNEYILISLLSVTTSAKYVYSTNIIRSLAF